MSDVAVLHGVTGETAGRPDEKDTLAQVDEIVSALTRLGHSARILSVGLNLSFLETLKATPNEIVFNLVEALAGDGRLIALAPLMLESLGLCFTGSSGTAIQMTTDKLMTKRVLRAAGLPTPEWDLTTLAADRLVIVKSVCEDASFGIGPDSIAPVSQAPALMEARRARFGGTWFAEAFIPGREFNLSLLEDEGAPRVLPVAEINFESLPAGRARIVDYGAKWDPADPAYAATERIFPARHGDDEALLASLESLALASWALLGLSGYARVDFRVDQDGRPWILEVNANPCLASDAGFAAAAEQAGLDYDQVIGAIVTAAKRNDRAKAA